MRAAQRHRQPARCWVLHGDPYSDTLMAQHLASGY